MAIYVDPLFDTTLLTRPGTPAPFRNTLACHLWSDTPGERGTRELIEFAVAIGLRAAWIQKPGTDYEHFDLLASTRERAVRAGAIEVAAWFPKLTPGESGP